jgi:tRNA modification GTPase
LNSRPDTIAAIATPPGKGAIAIVRVSGPAVPSLTQRLVRTKSPLRPRVATRATIVDERGERLDEALAVRFVAPHSYTGEEMLELQLHGSPVVARETVRALLTCGARLAEPGEFTRRAFLNDKMDLHAAAAVADVVDAETRAAARAALANLGGGLADEVRAVRVALAAILEELAGAIDFPDEVPEPQPAELTERLGPLLARLERLRHDGELGRLVREGVPVAIVGPPNAGKSSLLNALLGMERAIVSEIPGTTRDTIEETIVVDGVPVRLVDTAGIRAHADRLEAAGINRTERALATARIALVVIDGSQTLGVDAAGLLEKTRTCERILFFNKSDLGTRGVPAVSDGEAIVGSVRHEATLISLRRAIAKLGWGGELPDLARPHLVALHEFDAVNAAMDGLLEACRALRCGDPIDFVATELQRAFSSLGNVSEQVAAEEIIGRVFSRFCIGK